MKERPSSKLEVVGSSPTGGEGGDLKLKNTGMSEWSKETGLSSVVTLLRAGSNPAPGKGGDLKLKNNSMWRSG